MTDGIVDFDNHYYEPEDAFTRFGDEEVRDFVRWLAVGKRKHLVFGTQMATAIPNPTFDPIAKPGAFHRRLKELEEEGDWSNLPDTDRRKYGELERLPSWYRNRDDRLRVMTEQGVAKAVMFPTLGVGIEGLNPDDARMTYKLFRAFNRWLDDDWGFAYEERIFAAPHIPLIHPEPATEELDRVLAEGARVIALRPGPAYGRAPSDPVWDPFWARLDASGVPAAYHSYAGPDVYDEPWRLLWQRHGSSDPKFEANLRVAMSFDRPMVDTALALVLGNLFGRFPGLRILSIELGAPWVSYVMHMLDHAVGLTERHIEAFGETRPERPSEVFKRHFWISPFPEEDVVGLAKVIGADRVLFGSDWPHAEGTEQPRDYEQYLEGLETHDIQRIMRDNALELLGVS
jgi:predicted TIM-barrel fold metal-dependent hydrolase